MNIQSISSFSCKKPQFCAYQRRFDERNITENKKIPVTIYDLYNESHKIQKDIKQQNELIGRALADIANLAFLTSNNISPNFKDMYYKAIKSTYDLRDSANPIEI